MAATQGEPTVEQLEEDLRRAVQLWGDDCSTAEALRKVIREIKKRVRKEERNADAQTKHEAVAEYNPDPENFLCGICGRRLPWRTLGDFHRHIKICIPCAAILNTPPTPGEDRLNAFREALNNTTSASGVEGID